MGTSPPDGPLSRTSVLVAEPRAALWLDAQGRLRAEGLVPQGTTFLTALENWWLAERLPAAPAGRTNGSATAITDLLRVARAGNQQAKDLLSERARVLGEAVALLRDLLNPDELVVGGQAFTEYPEAMAQVEEAFAERSVLTPRDIRVTAFGNRVQEAGAGIVSLGGLYADPLGAMRRAGVIGSRIPEIIPESSA